MRLGISSYAFGWEVGVPGYSTPRPFDEIALLERARASGLGVVQFGDHVPLHTFSVGRLRRLRDAAGERGITLETGARGLDAEHLDRMVGLTRGLGASLLRFVIDGPGHEPPPSAVVALLRSRLGLLEDAGVTLGIENHDRFPSAVLRRMIDEIASPRVGICLDTANSLGAGEGVAQVLEQLAPVTVNLHLKDFAIRRVPWAMGFVVEGRPAGAGMLDVPAVLRAVEAAAGERCRTAVLETWVPPEPALADTLAKERRWAEESVARLKPLFAARAPA